VNPSARAALIKAAKPRARAIVNCVAASSARGLARHLDGLDHETQALILVLAASADHALLAAVCAETDDGLPAQAPAPEPARCRAEVLRDAHARVRQLRNAGEPVPAGLAELERAYQRVVKQQQRQRREAA